MAAFDRMTGRTRARSRVVTSRRDGIAVESAMMVVDRIRPTTLRVAEPSSGEPLPSVEQQFQIVDPRLNALAIPGKKSQLAFRIEDVARGCVVHRVVARRLALRLRVVHAEVLRDLREL